MGSLRPSVCSSSNIISWIVLRTKLICRFPNFVLNSSWCYKISLIALFFSHYLFFPSRNLHLIRQPLPRWRVPTRVRLTVTGEQATRTSSYRTSPSATRETSRSFNVPQSLNSKAEQGREKLAFRGLLNCTALMSTHSATTAFAVIWLDKGHLISECAWSELLRLQRNTSTIDDDRVTPTTEHSSHTGMGFSVVFSRITIYLRS
jgi:hypothetical protein